MIFLCDVVHRHKKKNFRRPATTPRFCSDDNELYFISLLADILPIQSGYVGTQFLMTRAHVEVIFTTKRLFLFDCSPNAPISIAVIFNYLNRGHNKDHKAQSTNTLQSNNDHV